MRAVSGSPLNSAARAVQPADPQTLTRAAASQVNYTTKYADLTAKVPTRYDSLDVPYHGKDNAGAGFWTASATVSETDQYYYHPDHLGSSSLITNLAGEIVQHLEYVPFGEVFLDEHTSTWNTPYKFNAKELDEETGLYYYGARYYDPRTSVWLSVDPLAEKYPGVGSYVYCVDNPVRFVDPDGRKIHVTSSDNSAVLKDINTNSRGTFGINKNGFLYLKQKEGKTGSEYYRNRIIAAIKSDKVIDVSKSQTFIDEKGKIQDVDLKKGGGLTLQQIENKEDLNGKNIQNHRATVIISGNEYLGLKDTEGKELRDKSSDILMHELVGHAIPWIIGKDTGNAVDNENKARIELPAGLNQQRKSEPNHKE